jgi:hypothetical protein
MVSGMPQTKCLNDAPAALLTPLALQAIQMQGLSTALLASPHDLARLLRDASVDVSDARCPDAWPMAAALMALAAWAALPVQAPAQPAADLGDLSAEEIAIIRAMRAARQ